MVNDYSAELIDLRAVAARNFLNYNTTHSLDLQKRQHDIISLKGDGIKMPKGDKYIDLTNYLKNSNDNNLKIAFREIETILGFKFPTSARSHKEWWGNDHTHSQATAWENAGYKTQDVSILNEEVSFVKIS